MRIREQIGIITTVGYFVIFRVVIYQYYRTTQNSSDGNSKASNTDLKWPVIVAFSNSPGVVWTWSKKKMGFFLKIRRLFFSQGHRFLRKYSYFVLVWVQQITFSWVGHKTATVVLLWALVLCVTLRYSERCFFVLRCVTLNVVSLRCYVALLWALFLCVTFSFQVSNKNHDSWYRHEALGSEGVFC